MAIKPFCFWGVGSVGDGSSTSVTFNLLTDPFVLGSAAAPGAGSDLNLTINLTATLLPTGITVIASSDGNTPTASLGILGNVVLTWPTALASGYGQTVYGRLEF